MTTPPLLASANLAHHCGDLPAAREFIKRLRDPRHCATCGAEMLPHERGRSDCDGCCRLPQLSPELEAWRKRGGRIEEEWTP